MNINKILKLNFECYLNSRAEPSEKIWSTWEVEKTLSYNCETIEKQLVRLGWTPYPLEVQKQENCTKKCTHGEVIKINHCHLREFAPNCNLVFSPDADSARRNLQARSALKKWSKMELSAREWAAILGSTPDVRFHIPFGHRSLEAKKHQGEVMDFTTKLVQETWFETSSINHQRMRAFIKAVTGVDLSAKGPEYYFRLIHDFNFTSSKDTRVFLHHGHLAKVIEKISVQAGEHLYYTSQLPLFLEEPEQKVVQPGRYSRLTVEAAPYEPTDTAEIVEIALKLREEGVTLEKAFQLARALS